MTSEERARRILAVNRLMCYVWLLCPTFKGEKWHNKWTKHNKYNCHFSYFHSCCCLKWTKCDFETVNAKKTKRLFWIIEMESVWKCFLYSDVSLSCPGFFFLSSSWFCCDKQHISQNWFLINWWFSLSVQCKKRVMDVLYNHPKNSKEHL